MATFERGNNGKPLKITVNATGSGYSDAGIWIEQFDAFKYDAYESEGDDSSDEKFRTNTVTYVNIDELIRLRDEINQALKEMIGV